MENTNNNVVYMVQTATTMANKITFKVKGIYTTREEAERAAMSYETCFTEGFITEVELNKEYENI